MSQPPKTHATAARAMTSISAAALSSVQDDENKGPRPSFESLETESESTIATEEVLTRFPTCPPEIRNMIFAAMINHPHLLQFSHSNHLYQARMIMQHSYANIPRSNTSLKHAELPSFMFLNKEANSEIMRYINIVPEAKKNNPLLYPWSYINPGYDVLYSSCGVNIPIASQAPGIQILALGQHDEGLWNTELDGSSHIFIEELFKLHCRDLVLDLHRLPSLKELLLVRDTTRMLGDFTRKPCKLDINVNDPEFRIQRHPCGFFGLLNDEIEKQYVNLKPRKFDNFVSGRPSRKLLDTYISQMTAINEKMYPGTKLPKITGVYNQWVDERGVWKWIEKI